MISSNLNKYFRTPKQTVNIVNKAPLKYSTNIKNTQTKLMFDSSQNVLTKEKTNHKKIHDNPFNFIKKQVAGFYDKHEKKTNTKCDSEIWIIKETLPYEKIFSIPDVNFQKYAVIAFEEEQLALDVRNIIANFDQKSTYIIEPIRTSYILDICEITNKTLIVFRRDIDNKIICKRYT